MRDAGEPARLEDRRARLALDEAALGIVDRDGAAAQQPVAHQPRGEHADQQINAALCSRLEIVRAARYRSGRRHENGVEEPGRILALGDLLRHAHDDAGSGDPGDRHQQREGIKQGQPGAVPWPEAPGEVQADAGVQPDDHGQRELAGDAHQSLTTSEPSTQG